MAGRATNVHASSVTDCLGMGEGMVFCPEQNACIDPFSDFCQMDLNDDDVLSFDGPESLLCYSSDGKARCDLSGSDDCHLGEGTTPGMRYIVGLSGGYRLPDGCTATCWGCDLDYAVDAIEPVAVTIDESVDGLLSGATVGRIRCTLATAGLLSLLTPLLAMYLGR